MNPGRTFMARTMDLREFVPKQMTQARQLSAMYQPEHDNVVFAVKAFNGNRS